MKRPILILLYIFGFSLYSLSSWAVSAEGLKTLSEKLDRWDVEETWPEVKEHLARDPRHPGLLDLAAQTAFHRGDYPEALRLMKAALEIEADEKRKAYALFVEETIGVTRSFSHRESPHFRISLDEKQDGILTHYLIDALEKTYRFTAEHYGFNPNEKIRVEVFPDSKSFYFATTLSARDIEVAGAVGIAQFNKLMVLSPRALVHGYRWLDAISHEYMHLLILRVTSNMAPIWFHEGLAKYDEARWRSGSTYLNPLYQSLLSRAYRDGKLIGFEKMEPSLLKLETPDDVQLAYAQAASAIEYIVAKAEHGGLTEIMKRMGTSSSKGASEAIQNVLSMGFDEFEKSWKDYLASKGLKDVAGVHVRRYKIKEGKADEERLDMAEIKSMVARNKAHLGDLLKERGRMEAAVLEYRRALTETQESVPILNRLSDVLIIMDRNEEALPLLNRAKDLSPDHPTTYTALGQTHLKLKDVVKAKEAFLESIQINPFNPEVHQGLATAYERLGNPAASLKEREIAKRLAGR